MARSYTWNGEPLEKIVPHTTYDKITSQIIAEQGLTKKKGTLPSERMSAKRILALGAVTGTHEER